MPEPRGRRKRRKHQNQKNEISPNAVRVMSAESQTPLTLR